MTALPTFRRTLARGALVGAGLMGGAATLAGAAIPAADGTIHACVDYHDTEPIPPKKPSSRAGDGAVRMVEQAGDCTGTETPLSWSHAGPPGPPGPPGAAGTAGDVWYRRGGGVSGPAVVLDDHAVLLERVTLPAGSDTVEAHAVARNEVGAYQLDCRLVVEYAGGTVAENLHQTLVNGRAGEDVSVVLTGAVTFEQEETVDLRCGPRDEDTSVWERVLVATRVAAIHWAGAPA